MYHSWMLQLTKLAKSDRFSLSSDNMDSLISHVTCNPDRLALLALAFRLIFGNFQLGYLLVR